MLSECRWLSERHPVPLFILNEHYSHCSAYLTTTRSLALRAFSCNAWTYDWQSPGTLEHSPDQLYHPALVLFTCICCHENVVSESTQGNGPFSDPVGVSRF